MLFKVTAVIALIAHFTIIKGSSTPTLSVTPFSNSIQVSWEKLSAWSSSSVFKVIIRTPQTVMSHEGYLCVGDPGVRCVFNSGDFNDLSACTDWSITVEAAGAVAGPETTTTLSPDPHDLYIIPMERNLYISWELPLSCEKSSRVIIRTRDVTVHEEVLSVPTSSLIYELSDDISTCDVLQVLVKSLTTNGESRGIEQTILYAELTEVSVQRIDSSTLSVTWEQPICVMKTEISCYDSDNNRLLGTDEVAATIYEFPVEDEQNLTICILPVGIVATHRVEGTEVCVDTAELSEPRIVQINLKAYTTSVDIIFLRLSEWNSVTDFSFNIKKGITNAGAELCSADSFSCTSTFPTPCTIKSDDFCEELPSCTDVFVEVNGGGVAATATTTTMCNEVTTTTTMSTTTPTTTVSTTTTTPTTTPSTTTESTSTTTESTSTTTESTSTTTETTSTTTESTSTTSTTTTTPTTTPTTTTTTEPTDGPDVQVFTTSDSVTVTWYRKGPFSDIDNFHISITNMEMFNLNDHIDIRSEPCSASVSCTNPKCSFDSKTECPDAVFTSCSKVSVIVEDAGAMHPQDSVTAEIAPDSPSDISVELSGQNVDLEWTQPSACQTGSRLTVTLKEDEVVNEILDAHTNTYNYQSDSDMDCDIGMATVTAIGADGESEGTSAEFLLHEMKSLKAYRNPVSTIEVTWEKSTCVKKMNFTWYNGSSSQENYINSEEKPVSVITEYTINNVGSYDVVTVCVIPKAHGTLPGWTAGESQCVEAADTTTTSATTTTTTTPTTTTTEATTTSTTTSSTTTTKSTSSTESTSTPSTLTPTTGTSTTITSASRTSTTISTTEETTSNTTDSNPTVPPKDNTALIVGLSVGIPVGLIAIAGVAYLLKVKVFGKAAEMSTSL